MNAVRPPIVFNRRRRGCEDPIGYRAKEGLFVGEVPVERAGGDAELACEPPHRQIGESVVVEKLGGLVDHVSSMKLHPCSLNTVQVLGCRRSASVAGGFRGGH